MSRPINTFYNIIGCILMMLFMIMPLSCENQQAKEDRLAKERADKLEQDKRMNEFIYRENSILTGLKYNVDDNKVFNLLVDLDQSFDKRLSFENRNYIKELIETLAKKYDINPDLLAKILLDYKKIAGKGSD